MQAKNEAPIRVRTHSAHLENLHLIEVPPALDSLAEVRAFVDTIPLWRVLSPDRVFDFKVSLSEAAANAIEHAKASVDVSVWLLSDRVVADVSNVGEFGSPDDGAAQGRTRGYGLKLMVCLADEVTFIRERRGRTTVRLTFLRTRHEVPPPVPVNGDGRR